MLLGECVLSRSVRTVPTMKMNSRSVPRCHLLQQLQLTSDVASGAGEKDLGSGGSHFLGVGRGGLRVGR